MASRSGPVTPGCVVCGDPLPAGRARTTCSDGCRQRAWRLRHQPETTPPALRAARHPKDHTLDECPECEARLLGSQLCETCHTLMRRLGAGGLSPCCGQPITVDEPLNS